MTWIPNRKPGATGQYYPGPIRHGSHLVLLFIGLPTVLFIGMVVGFQVLKFFLPGV